MKTKYLIKAAWLLAVVMLIGCSQEENNREAEKKGRASFTTQESSSSTRTTGIYSGSGIDFYWTGKDKTIWLIKSDGQPMRSSTSSVTSRTARATFYFEDDNGLNESSYKLRYTGSKYTNEESSSDKVTIKAEQIQDKPNDAEHIGTDGDCGTATATYVGMNKDNRRHYSFRLKHQAAYLTFIPYSTASINMQLIEIKVETTNTPIAGTYEFGDNGINTNNPTSSSNTITLKLKDPSQFPILNTPSPDKNAAIMVLAPGYYTSFKVTYKLKNSSGSTETQSKTYYNQELKAGKNKPVKYNLA